MKIWSSNCPDDAEFIEFTTELQQITLNAHNKLRNQIALGEIPRYPTAQRMATMVTIFNSVYKNKCFILHIL